VAALRPQGDRGADIPAVGFAYGLERVAAQLRTRAEATRPALLLTASDTAYSLAMHLADSLRTRGYRVLLDVRSRSLQANLRDARRRGCDALLVVGDHGADGNVETLDETSLPQATPVLWHDLAPGTRFAGPRNLSLDDLLSDTLVPHDRQT
jgi:histidyl-tRNA synthetase